MFRVLKATRVETLPAELLAPRVWTLQPGPRDSGVGTEATIQAASDATLFLPRETGNLLFRSRLAPGKSVMHIRKLDDEGEADEVDETNKPWLIAKAEAHEFEKRGCAPPQTRSDGELPRPCRQNVRPAHNLTRAIRDYVTGAVPVSVEIAKIATARR
ncbi:hypothetical protein CSUB01_12456 [Colletotrichum sublineola]|uniref:Uncharacterized protein n=1 Tax=Colletotrichum sublineola TaxID=1173701 RepID=A0A066XQ50_COLSU|nr:hypothetical protein CSUB01_12456 [Colletotrichum sublineola]